MTAPTQPRTPSGNGRERDTTRRAPVGGIEPKPRAEFEVGVSSHLPFQTSYKNMWEALRSDDPTVRALQAMRKSDGQARALYRLIALPIRAALKTATFVPEEGAEGGDEEARFVQDMFTLPVTGGGMVVPFGRFIAQLLMAVFDGFSAFEMVYWTPTSGPLKGKYTLKKLAHRPSEQLTFILNNDSEMVGVRQQTMYHDRQVDVMIDAANIVYYAANEEERPFYGQSYFNAAFKHWEAKFKLYVVAHIAAQRAAVGTRVGTLPQNPGTQEKAEFQRSLAELGIAQWMTIPDDYKVESLKEFTGFDFLAYINHHNSQMSKSILAAFFDDSQGTGGDASLVDFGRQSDALFLLMLQTIMGEIEEVINTQVIPKFIDWNFNSGMYPKFTFGQLSDEQKGALLDLFKALSAAGEQSIVAPEMFREMEIQVAEQFGLEVDWEAVEAREEEEARQAELAMQITQMNTAAQDDPQTGPAVGGDAATMPAGGANIDPSQVPEGFVLSNRDEFNLTLSDMAAELLDDAIVELVRGKPNSGGPKYVRSTEGARTYGVPVGSPITRDMDKRLGHHGKKGERFGANHTQNPDKKPRGKDVTRGTSSGGGPGAPATTASQTLGGGKGDTGNTGGVSTGLKPGEQKKPQRIYSNPKMPGAQLIDYGDGTVAIRDADGRMTPRQRFDIAAFKRYGWKVDSAASGADTDTAKGNDTVKRPSASKKPTGR
jgi:hypothetical protein